MTLLCRRTTRKTGRALAAYLGIRARTTPTDEPLIRWGNSTPPHNTEDLNTGPSISNATDKYRALEILSDAGIRTPPHSRTITDLDTTRPILGRNTHHHGGLGIRLYMQPRDHGAGIRESDFYTQYIPRRREFRVHTALGEVLGVKEKRWDTGSDPHLIQIAWSHRNGWVHLTPRHQPAPLESIARKAAEALSLHFAAVDIILGEDPRHLYVLELNTAPGLWPQMLKAYGDTIAAHAGLETHPETVGE